MKRLEKIEAAVTRWPNITVHSHRFGGREFRFGSGEIGHMHVGGIVDIPFPRAVHDWLLAQGFAEEHHWVPDSGWTTFRIRGDNDMPRALWLMRLSYLRYALKAAPDPAAWLEQEARELQLSPELHALLEAFVPRRNGAREILPA
jgi:hypothetical protein